MEVAGTPDTETYAEILATCACLQLRKTNRVVTQLYDEALRPIGLRSTQLPILVTLAAHGVLSLTGLADRLVLHRTTLIRNIRPLQRRRPRQQASAEMSGARSAARRRTRESPLRSLALARLA